MAATPGPVPGEAQGARSNFVAVMPAATSAAPRQVKSAWQWASGRAVRAISIMRQARSDAASAPRVERSPPPVASLNATLPSETAMIHPLLRQRAAKIAGQKRAALLGELDTIVAHFSLLATVPRFVDYARSLEAHYRSLRGSLAEQTLSPQRFDELEARLVAEMRSIIAHDLLPAVEALRKAAQQLKGLPLDRLAEGALTRQRGIQ
jgi:hypothetical protein